MKNRSWLDGLLLWLHWELRWNPYCKQIHKREDGFDYVRLSEKQVNGTHHLLLQEGFAAIPGTNVYRRRVIN